ncbi:MAG TPA: META domain-containing protein [Vicinamibacteria bacterium]
MLSSRPTVPALLAAGLILGCASMPTASEPPSLDGTAWVLAELPGETSVAGRAATLRFEEGRAMGSDGCNHFTTTYTARGSALEVAAPGASTLMACPPDVTRQAQAFTAALAGARAYRIEGGRLELLAADGRTLAALAPQAAELPGTSWLATGINNGKEAVVSPLADSTVTLEFAADGRASGSAGCNRFTTRYQVDGSGLSFQPAAATRMMCGRPELMEQEQNFLKALETVASARFEGDQLELRTAGGALAVRLTRAGRP